ncbi:MAG: family 10 glycosylhydrolase [Bacteroidota bacterium]
MTKKIIVSLILLFVLSNVAVAQFERETRAVWLATNFRLDWPPPTFDQEKQKHALIQIFDDIKSKNLNTVYFQAYSNGMALFHSSFEPFSPYVTGTVNGAASYDPLKFAIEQAHKRGLEIHAWVNIFKCFNGTENNILSDPNHISKRKPEWVIEDFRDGQKSYWLDPGLPEVREYIADMLAEMVEKYDLDGVQLDYIRYPGKNFDDHLSYEKYGNGIPIDDWRRNNITDAVALIYKKIKAVKHFVKVGAAPIGIYKNVNGVNGWEGLTEVYQDSREWLKRGIVDYLAPQIYWGIDDKPRFDVIAKEWTGNSFGRNIVLGIAAYKENVKNDLDRMIKFARAINASGVSFFRYGNIKDDNFAFFPYKTFPASMTWLDGIRPAPPTNLVLKTISDDKNLYSMNWQFNDSTSTTDSIRYFALYSPPNKNAELLPSHFSELIPANQNSIKFGIPNPHQVNYYFALKSVSKLWNESVGSSNVVEVKLPEMNQLLQASDYFARPVLFKYENGASRILLFADKSEKIKISGVSDGETTTLLTETVSHGKNLLELDNDLAKYQSLKIAFESSRRELELKL